MTRGLSLRQREALHSLDMLNRGAWCVVSDMTSRVLSWIEIGSMPELAHPLCRDDSSRGGRRLDPGAGAPGLLAVLLSQEWYENLCSAAAFASQESAPGVGVAGAILEYSRLLVC